MRERRSARELRRYLDPFASFRSIAADPDALEYNCRHRRQLLAYAGRWMALALACAAGMELLALLALAEPLLCAPILALALGFSVGICIAALSVAVYVTLGMVDAGAPTGRDRRSS